MSRTGTLNNTMGNSGKEALAVDLGASLKLEFHDSSVTSDGGLLPYPELDEAVDLTAMGGGIPSELSAPFPNYGKQSAGRRRRRKRGPGPGQLSLFGEP